ncbi:TetR/AcrR family transcriptional regulator C-terminal domain-containing protein [Nocardioides sp. BYT-33-1]|uniref:TetR/AcrR family transcriptional regulator C-terminal domain-containing protein n=1 Tax=Nocardioides sp. BYT-33-1 TaxID=3416952 RepID=UPI003F52F926
MTKKQASLSRASKDLTPKAVLRAALEVLDERGIAGVSTRAVADRLGVRMNTVLWHVKTRAHLQDLMADAILGEVDLDGLDGDGRQRAFELMTRLRRTLLAHRDGALVLSGTFPSMPSTLRFADRLLAALLEDAPTPKVAAWTAWGLAYFTVGLVQEEQSAPAQLPEEVAARLSDGAYPALAAVVEDFASTDFDERFAHGVGALLDAVTRAP